MPLCVLTGAPGSARRPSWPNSPRAIARSPRSAREGHRRAPGGGLAARPAPAEFARAIHRRDVLKLHGPWPVRRTGCSSTARPSRSLGMLHEAGALTDHELRDRLRDLSFHRTVFVLPVWWRSTASMPSVTTASVTRGGSTRASSAGMPRAGTASRSSLAARRPSGPTSSTPRPGRLRSRRPIRAAGNQLPATQAFAYHASPRRSRSMPATLVAPARLPCLDAALLLLMEGVRVKLVATGQVAPNGFDPMNATLSPFMQRLAPRACQLLEGLPLFWRHHAGRGCFRASTP